MNHLRPLAASERCAVVWVVSTLPIPESLKIKPIYPPPWLQATIGSVPARLLLFAWIAIRKRPDVVGGFHLLINGLVALLLARLIRARALYICGGGPRELTGGGFHAETRLFRLLRAPDAVIERRLLRAVQRFDLTVTMGHRAAGYFRARGIKGRIEVIPGGIDGHRYQASETTRAHDLILVGRLVQVKRIDLFLETVRDLAADIPGISAVVVGEGSLEPALRDLARRLGVEPNVRFVGHQRDVAAWLAASRIFVLTSDSEGLSLALMEAMMAGLPCVVSDVGELGELVQHGVNGYLIRERSSRAFAALIADLLRNPDDYARLSAASRKSALRFEQSEISRTWDRCLQDS